MRYKKTQVFSVRKATKSNKASFLVVAHKGRKIRVLWRADYRGVTRYSQPVSFLPGPQKKKKKKNLMVLCIQVWPWVD